VEHAASPLQVLTDIPARTSRLTGDREWRYWPIAEEPGGIFSRSAGTMLLAWPEGFSRAIGSAGELEWHPHHEEVFILTGTTDFRTVRL